MRLARAIAPLALATSLVIVAGCSDDATSGTTAGADPRTIEVSVANGTVTPQPGRVEVDRGSTVRIVVTSDETDELHVHGYDKEAELAPDKPATVGLLGMVLLVAVTFVAAALAAGRLGHAPRRSLPAPFAHSVVPIALGYVVAHYYSLFVLEGQRTFILLSDPLGTGADWLGTADRGVDARLVTATGVATLQVVAVVTGHLLGVVTSHDRAVRLFPRSQAVAGQVPLLLLMVGYTLGGLTLLFAA